MAFAFRFGNAQPFVRHKTSNDDRNGSVEAGVITYGKDDNDQETYQVTSFEVGGRSDHIADALESLTGSEPVKLTTASPLEGDVDLMRKAPEPKSAKPASEASA